MLIRGPWRFACQEVKITSRCRSSLSALHNFLVFKLTGRGLVGQVGPLFQKALVSFQSGCLKALSTYGQLYIALAAVQVVNPASSMLADGKVHIESLLQRFCKGFFHFKYIACIYLMTPYHLMSAHMPSLVSALELND